MRSKKYLFLSVFLIALFAVFSCKDQWSGKTDVVSISKIAEKGKMPQVQMSHKVHDEHGIKCVVCHHKFENDAREKKCSICHKGDEGKDILHSLCKDCHKENKMDVEKCSQCHKAN